MYTWVFIICSFQEGNVFRHVCLSCCPQGEVPKWPIRTCSNFFTWGSIPPEALPPATWVDPFPKPVQTSSFVAHTSIGKREGVLQPKGLLVFKMYLWVFLIVAETKTKFEDYLYQGVLCDDSLKQLNQSIFKTYSTDPFFGFLLKEVSTASCKYVCSTVYPTTCRYCSVWLFYIYIYIYICLTSLTRAKPKEKMEFPT